jgi:two-component system chemotaxis sensor kinase CheA
MDDVLRQVVHVFAAEVKEQANTVIAALMAMEANPASIPQQIEDLYRQAHSLKGSSSSLGVVELAELAHNLEEALLPVRRAQTTLLSHAMVDLSLRAMDAAKLRVDGLVNDTDLGLRETEAAAAALAELAGLSAHDPAPKTEAEASAAHVVEAVGAPSAPRPAPIVPVAEEAIDDETLRIHTGRLLPLERRLDDLRALRGRLEGRGEAVRQLIQAVDKLWRSDGNEATYRILRQLSALRRTLLEDAELAQAHAVELDDNLRALRLVPFDLVRVSLGRALRDACRRTGKDAQLVLVGGEEAQLDRRLLDALKNPLLHLVRNAVDHGIEPASVRAAVGKPERATVTVTVEQEGRDVTIAVADDGRGIDVNAVRARAIERGLLSPETQRLDPDDAFELLFKPGFSTAQQVTELSGRGVGLDVVREAIGRLHGRIDVTSTPGQGARFVLTVPLTVAASETMLLEEGGRPFALPLASIERIVRADVNALRPVAGRTFFQLEDQPIPVIRLARLLGLTERHEGSAFRTIAIIRGGSTGERAAVVCERLLGGRDLILSPLPLELMHLSLLSTGAILPNGQAIFILSPRALVDAAHDIPPANDVQRKPSDRGGSILVADDSITTRSLLRNALEASGFRVRVAADGDEAWRLALAEPFDLIVSDVRMPRLDGYGLVARLRSDPRTAKLPIVLFSSLDSDEDRRRGTSAGASAYLSKSAFDRGHLIDVVNGLIRGTA